MGLPAEIDKLKNLIRELELGSRVKMLGRVDGEEKEKLYQEAAMVVLPSRREAFSLVALEALVHRAPLISFDIEGLNWIPKNCSMKAKPFDETNFSNIMVNTIANPEYSRAITEAGWEFGKNQTWDNQYQKYRAYIERILLSV